MSTLMLAGDALGVLDVQTVQITAYDVTTTYKITCNGKVISVLGTGGTTSTTAAALQAALAASTIREFQEMTWTVSTSTITGTANESSPDGKTHTFTSSVSGGAGTIGAVTSSVSPKGAAGLTAENVVDTAGARALPTNADTFILGRLDSDLKWNLRVLQAVTTLDFHALASFTGELGLRFTNENNAKHYWEYRPVYLHTDGGTFTIGEGEGDGSGRIMLNAQGSAATFYVIRTAESVDDSQHALVIKGTNAANTLKAIGGSTDVAPHPGEFATLLTLTAGADAIVRTSRNTTLGTVFADEQSQLTIDSAASLTDIAALNIRGSALVTYLGDNTITAVTMDGTQPQLTLMCSAACAITTLNMYAGAILDLDDCPSTVTIGTLNVYGECTINDRSGKLLITNAVPRWSLVTFNGTKGRPFTLGTP